MATSLQTLIPLALFVILAMTNSAQSATSFDFVFEGDEPSELNLEGDAYFPADSPYLRLTKTNSQNQALPSSYGRAIYRDPVLFKKSGAQASFQTTLKFIVRQTDSNPADGLVFFIAPVDFDFSKSTNGGDFGVFSSTGRSPGVFAVEFDVYVNSWDPPFRHLGIDIESRDSKNVAEILDSFIGEEVTMTVNYDGASQVISTTVSAGKETVESTYVYDLSTILDDKVHVGLAASTGDHVAIHDVASWSFKSTAPAIGLKERSYIRQSV